MKGIALIITPRERYGSTGDCVRSALAGLDPRVPVAFAGGGAPPDVRTFLRRTAERRRNFKFLLKDRFLGSNAARNLGLSLVPRRSDVVFLENDVLPLKGWLPPLLRCAKEEKAGIVSPLVLEGAAGDPDPLVHITGLKFHPAGSSRPRTVEHLENHRKNAVGRLRRQEVDAVEFHCFFAARRLLDRIPLDDRFGPMYAHLDLCFRAKDLGTKCLVEPASQVLFLNPRMEPLGSPEDLGTFLGVWGNGSYRKEARAFSGKWGYRPAGPLMWGHEEWGMLNLRNILETLEVLDPLDRALLRVARLRVCPGPLRPLLEMRPAARALRKFPRPHAGLRPGTTTGKRKP